jgi:crotonobetainyl-CoA:carnitine CoA-transferase CaiB-like acyl-CoA transferase
MSRSDGMYAHVRVLDLSDASGLLTGQILADLGADVIQVVPVSTAAEDSMRRTRRESVPGGSLAPSTARDGPAHGSSATVDAIVTDDFHRAYLRGKRLLELDLDAPEAAARIDALLAGADVLIETLSNAEAERLHLDVAGIAARRPHLIHVSITPFGRTGPKRDWAATDLTIAAASGFLFVSGAAGETPVRVAVPQAHAHAGADAAVATLIALREQRASGRGQHIDVSAQHSFTLALLGRGLDGAVRQPRAERSSGYGMVGAVRVRNIYPVRDGFVVMSPGIVPPVAAFMRRLMGWAAEEGLCDPAMIDWDWATVAMRMVQGAIDQAQWDRIDAAIAQLLGSRTKLDIMQQAVSRKLLLAPVLHVGELLDSPQLAARGYVQRDPRGARLGAFAKFGASPLRLTNDPLRVHGDALSAWTRRPPPARAAQPKPLAGLKVLDLFWVVAGPGATRMLADYGATVIHVESRNRPDMLRAVPPYIDGVPDPERTPGFHTTHANKLNLSLDLTSAEGRAVLTDLIRWADVVGESFSAGVIDRMGFGYEAVRAINPRIIMVSSSLLGQTGPWREYAGFGNLAGAVCGFYQLAGPRDATPVGCFGPYTDFMGVRYNAIAILAALAHRDRTGERQFIDMAQAEAALHFLAPAAIAYLERGEIPRANANRDAAMAPHGVYPALGADRWVAIAIRNDGEWQRFRAHAKLAEFDTDASLATLSGRQSAADRIDAAIADWTRTRDARAVEADLQTLGIAAHALSDTHELLADPQLAAREYVVRIAHDQFGETAIENSRFTLSAAPAARPTSAVSYGSHNAQVLGDILGYSGERIAELEARGVLQ